MNKGDLPTDWRWVRLGEVCIEVFSGVWGYEFQMEEPAAKVIRVSDIKETLTIDYESAPLRRVNPREISRFRLQEGDLVVVKSSGSKAKVISGRTAYFGNLRSEYPFLPSNFTLALRTDRKLTEPRYLWFFLNSKSAKQFVESIVGTTPYPNLKKKDYLEMPVPLHPFLSSGALWQGLRSW